MTGLFEGLLVIELADRRNQYAGKLLADGGARVIQVEPPGGSPGRTCGPFVNDREDPNASLDYWFYNTGKESVQVDLSEREGVDVVKNLIRGADVLIESRLGQDLAEQGLDYNSLRGENPGLIHVSITDFGQDGPWRDFRCNDIAHLALGGEMAVTGYSDPRVPPIGGQGRQAWLVACTYAAHSTVAALVERLESGAGQYIDVSIHDCAAICCTEGSIPEWIFNNRLRYRRTGEHAVPNPGRGPQNLQAADGRWLNTVMGQLTPPLWENLLGWMKEEGVAGELEDPAYMDEAYRTTRWREGSEIQEACARLLARVPSSDAMLRAQSVGLTWAVIQAPEENYSIKHWSDRGFFTEIEQPGAPRPVRFLRGPFLMPDTPYGPARPAPRLGEHTQSVRSEMQDDEQPPAREPQDAAAIKETAAETAATDRERKGPLSGVRVLDITWWVVGPLVTRLLADLGAEVIKIERHDQFDGARSDFWPNRRPRAGKPAHPESPNQSGTFSIVNANKKGITLNARHPQGLALLEALIAESDCLVENFSAGVLDRWGLTWERLQEINPRLVYLSASGWGHEGEWKGFRNYGPTAAAFSGLTFASGLPGRESAGWGFAYMDVEGAFLGSFGLLGALYQAKRTGAGARVDYAIIEGAMNLLGPLFLDFDVNGRSTRRPDFPPGNHSLFPRVAPHNTYRCTGQDRLGQDLWCFIACETDADWGALCSIIGREDLVSDPRFATNDLRLANQDELDEIIQGWTEARTRHQVMDLCQRAGIIGAAVQNAEDLLEHDPQLRHREVYPIIDHPELGAYAYAAYPARLSRTPAVPARGGPLYREHNRQVYGEILGLSVNEIERLEAEGVI